MIKKHLVLTTILGAPWMVGGCSPTIKVEAPDEPIVVNLNVKIEHSLKLKVAKEVEDIIKKDADIF